MESMLDWLAYLSREHRGKVVGVSLGLIFGLVTVTFGIGKALFIAFCLLAGYFVGCRIDQGQSLLDLWQRISRRQW
jgi:uncharacterized membrane protein